MAKKQIEAYKSITASTKALLQGKEGRAVDFKVDPKGLTPEDIVAFANAQGGTVLLGVQETSSPAGHQIGKVVGCKVDDKTRLAIVSKGLACMPSIDVQIRIENKATKNPIMRIDIPEGADKPYSTSSGTYKIRSEGRNVGIDPSLMKAMILQSETDEFVKRFRHAATDVIKELSDVRKELSEQIERVRQAAELARDTAARAEDAAQEATQAAMEATAAAEDAAQWAASQ